MVMVMTMMLENCDPHTEWIISVRSSLPCHYVCVLVRVRGRTIVRIYLYDCVFLYVCIVFFLCRYGCGVWGNGLSNWYVHRANSACTNLSCVRNNVCAPHTTKPWRDLFQKKKKTESKRSASTLGTPHKIKSAPVLLFNKAGWKSHSLGSHHKVSGIIPLVGCL